MFGPFIKNGIKLLLATIVFFLVFKTILSLADYLLGAPAGWIFSAVTGQAADLHSPLISVVLCIALLLVFAAIAHFTRVVGAFESYVLLKIPVVKTFWTLARRVSEVLTASQNGVFTRIVTVEMDKGLTMGYVAGEVNLNGTVLLSVALPIGTGFQPRLFQPDQVRDVDLTFQQFLEWSLSSGALCPSAVVGFDGK